MTPEMAFECVLVSDDAAVLDTINPILQNFSISTNVCPNPAKIGNWLGEGSADLFVFDVEAVSAPELLQQVHNFQPNHKPTVLAVSATDMALSGVHVILRKPVTPDSSLRSIKVAYSKMMQDFRKHTRFALMTPVVAMDESNRTVALTVTNIGAGGVGLTTKDNISIGSILSFQLRLPGMETELCIRARVLWTRHRSIFGCEFVRLSSFDTQLLHAWLESRYRIKMPLINL